MQRNWLGKFKSKEVTLPGKLTDMIVYNIRTDVKDYKSCLGSMSDHNKMIIYICWQQLFNWILTTTKILLI